MRLLRSTHAGWMLGLLLIGACATTRGPVDRDDREVVTREDIAPHLGSLRNAYQIVERLHPQWLRTRSNRITSIEQQDVTEGDVVVYIDGVRAGGTEALRAADAETVSEIRYLNAARAVRLGTGHQHGAIMVRTR